VYAIVPPPVPLLPDVMVTHDTPVDADQLHPLCVVTTMLPDPAEVLKAALAGEIE
jgi:hypothetical protein